MNVIKNARMAAGLSQKRMSDIMDIPKRTIENWEEGKRICPSYVEKLVVAELGRIAKMKGVWKMERHEYLDEIAGQESGIICYGANSFGVSETAEIAILNWSGICGIPRLSPTGESFVGLGESLVNGGRTDLIDIGEFFDAEDVPIIYDRNGDWETLSGTSGALYEVFSYDGDGSLVDRLYVIAPDGWN